MKLMMNGALTIGIRDGATLEMAEEAWEENMFLFGLTASQVDQARGSYTPYWHYEDDPEARRALDPIASGHFNPGEPGVFDPILDVLLAKGDFYLHLADLRSYSEAHARLGQFYLNPEAWDAQIFCSCSEPNALSAHAWARSASTVCARDG